MDLEEIKAKKKIGDIATVASKLGISQTNASKALNNPLHKRHEAVRFNIELLIMVRAELDVLVDPSNEEYL